MKKLVYIGGGSSSFAILEGLKKDFEITALVPVTDSGGSTGRLRGELKIIPPGDLRQCLIALSDAKDVKDLLSYRFEKGELGGHNAGNILLASLSRIKGGMKEGAAAATAMFDIKGTVLPISDKTADLGVQLADGREIIGEHEIDEVEYKRPSKIEKVFIKPRVKASPAAITAIKEADLIVMSPGDLYTSLAACLVVGGVSEAIWASKATKIYLVSLMTKYGHTDKFTVSDFVEVVYNLLGKKCLNYVIYNTEEPCSLVGRQYAKKKGYMVTWNKENFSKDTSFIGKNLLKDEVYKKSAADILTRSWLRHDPGKVARIIKTLR